ncbi:hypothetical protein M9458_001054, partial [Cirrhinus mrigala]
DLMRLAKQFDFNMRQDEAQEQNSNAPGSERAEEQEPPHDDRFTTAHNVSTVKPNDEKPVDERGHHQEMDDDLDFLFDGPTQQLSGRLSQASDCRTQGVPERNHGVVKASASQKVSTFIATENHGSKQVNKADDFDDDWNSDGLLDDSLLLEMTQNPDLFAVPHTPFPAKHHMHQKTNSGGIKQQGESAVTARDGFSDVLDEDLDSFFASDDIWDDGVEDDDLFCEACDNLEELSGNAETSATNSQQNTCETASLQMVFAHPYPPKKPAANVSTSSANTSVSLYGQKTHAVNSGPTGRSSNVSCDATRPSGPSSNGAYKFKQVRSSSVVGHGTCAVPSTQQGHERGVLAVLQSDVRTADSHQFKKPYSDSF